MFKSTAARATAVVVVVAALGGTTALAASRATPSPGTSQKPGGQPGQSQAKREGNRVGGQVTAVTETELTIDHKTRPRGPRPGGQPAGSITFVMDGDTKVYLAGDRDTDIGRGAIHVDDRVGVKFTEAGDKKLAKVVVVLPDGHAGRVESKDADGHSFTIKTRDGDTIK
ncbi:MAG: hypothetical protein QOE92_2093, partial [Chloroflexota bacterium]|nr:hypothetical protein [Chloroflexota bacterium]